MLHSLDALRHYTIGATDGDIGTVDDLLFDDQTSLVRWVVVDTGTWLSGRKVLLAPQAFGPPDHAGRRLPTSLTREQVESSPDISTHRPISRQAEAVVHDYYAWEPYWHSAPPVYAYPWGGLPLAARDVEPAPGTDPVEREIEARLHEEEDPHLRSARDIVGYYVHASDGDIGHVEDLLYDEESRQIRYVVVDTRNWLPGRKVLVAIDWFKDINDVEQTITTSLSRVEIETSPEYDPTRTAGGGDYERRLHEHYGRRAYWA
jgi:hypothetical protein